MKKYIFILFTMLSTLAFAQDYSDPQNMDVNYNSEARYEGGMEKLAQDLHLNMNFSQQDADNKTRGTITVSFDVDTEGNIVDVLLFGGINDAIDQEFERVFAEMKFLPARIDGNPVKMNLILDIPIIAVSQMEKEKMKE